MRELIKRVVHACGYEIHKTPKVVRGFRAEYLARFGNFATVIDVGVGFGTDELYEAFPDAHFVLVEPVAEYRATLARIASRYRTTIVPKAVGEQPGRLEDTYPTLRSFLLRSVGISEERIAALAQA